MRVACPGGLPQLLVCIVSSDCWAVGLSGMLAGRAGVVCGIGLASGERPKPTWSSWFVPGGGGMRVRFLWVGRLVALRVDGRVLAGDGSQGVRWLSCGTCLAIGSRVSTMIGCRGCGAVQWGKGAGLGSIFFVEIATYYGTSESTPGGFHPLRAKATVLRIHLFNPSDREP